LKLNKNRIKNLLIGSFLISAIVLISLITYNINERTKLISVTKSQAEGQATRAAIEIASNIDSLTAAEDLADQFTRKGHFEDYKEVENLLRAKALEKKEVSSFTAAFNPKYVPTNALPPNGPSYSHRLYSPYTGMDKGEITFTRVEDEYDYTLPDPSMIETCDLSATVKDRSCFDESGDEILDRTEWFHAPIRAEKSTWGEPYFGSSGGVYWAGFGIPFYDVDGSIAGIISADMKLADIQKLVSELTPGNQGGGYGFIVSQTGLFISHPISDFVNKERNIIDINPDWDVGNLQNQYKENDNKPFIMDHVDIESKQESWVFFVPVKNAEWWIGISLDKHQFFKNTGFLEKERSRLAWISAGAILTLSLALCLILKVYSGNRQNLWIVVCLICLFLLAGIVYLWVINLNSETPRSPSNIELIDGSNTAKVVNDVALALSNGNDTVNHSATGMFIQSLEFSKSGKASLSGYIWGQSDVNSTPHEITLPDGQETILTPLYQQKNELSTVQTQSFSTEIKQKFDYRKYPFQKEDIEVRIRPINLASNTLLTPDLKAYHRTNPESYPGVDKDIHVDGWEVVGSFFSLNPISFGTNFGTYEKAKEDASNELVFNVSLKRSYISPLLTNFIPISVVALLLYSVLLIISTDRTTTSRFGFSTSTVLGFCGSLFFAVIVAHLNLRSGLGAQGVIYIESFYFALYGALVVVALNSLFVVSGIQVGHFKVGNNDLIKILYWPMMMLILYIVTFLAFT
jgi:uncharacterized membrane protein YeaQ/YmgE (transglycosylase-associated protein family)